MLEVLIILGIMAVCFIVWVIIGIVVFITFQESIEGFLDISVDEENLGELGMIGFVLPFIIPIILAVKAGKKIGELFK